MKIWYVGKRVSCLRSQVSYTVLFLSFLACSKCSKVFFRSDVFTGPVYDYVFRAQKNLLATLTYFTTDTTSTCVDISGELECFVPLEK